MQIKRELFSTLYYLLERADYEANSYQIQATDVLAEQAVLPQAGDFSDDDFARAQRACREQSLALALAYLEAFNALLDGNLYLALGQILEDISARETALEIFRAGNPNGNFSHTEKSLATLRTFQKILLAEIKNSTGGLH